MGGVLDCIERFYPETHIHDHISKVEIRTYRTAAGAFECPQAKRLREANDADFNSTCPAIIALL